MQRKKILLAGQQNAGKSTLFNILTGARQHVANYPGVTVDKKMGFFSGNDCNYKLVDLPGTYSLTSFSLEERVARKALREEHPDVVLNVMDAANINRSLHLTLQLIELGLPLVLVLNMMDVAKKAGIWIDTEKLAQQLDLPVVKSIGRTGKGVKNIIRNIEQSNITQYRIAYPKLEAVIDTLSDFLDQLHIKNAPASRWMSLRLLEEDTEIDEWLKQNTNSQTFIALKQLVNEQTEIVQNQLPIEVNDYIVAQRQQAVTNLISACVTIDTKIQQQTPISQKIDRIVLNKFGAPLVLIATVFIIYEVSIGWGYELTNYWWPYLAKLREIVASLLPSAGFLHDPYIRSLGLWVVDSGNTLLNYIPIFLILFASIAILEDSGYMARIAFIADKILHRFGLHGQSTLPMILSGVFAGGCAVPGVMATKGIPDERARIATILTVPFMNCLAKVPLYTLLLGIFFVEDKALMMFYISTITVIAALLIAKLLTKTVLRRTETSPFIMELPRYNIPTLRSVLTRSIERTWIYIKKVGTVVLAVSTVIFVLLQFPGIPENEQLIYQQQAQTAVAKFEKKIAKTEYANKFDENSLPQLVNFYTDYKRAKLNANGAAGSKQVKEKFAEKNAEFFTIIAPPKGNKAARKVNKALKKLVSARKKIRREMKERRLKASLLGSFGRMLEPVTQYAGFDWKINVALFSSFAARESSVATLGVLFQQDEDTNETLEKRMGNSEEFSSQGEVAATALILFFILYPPCLATVMMIKVQTQQYRWMILSIILPTFIGLTVASIVYTIGTRFNFSGVQMMSFTYFSGLFGLLLIWFKDAFIRKKQDSEIIPTKTLC